MTARDGFDISVVIASHGRPRHLARCLTSLRFQDHPRFEIVVVADKAGLEAVASHPLAAFCRGLRMDEAHLSRARNAGVAAAAGAFVAFIDDDSVAEPRWLSQLAQALADTGADAVTGHVRGRNGISFQSRLTSIDAEAETHDETPARDGAHVPQLDKGRALKLVGTNSAVRRDLFLKLGGFDPAYPYFLEDSDLSFRLAAAGGKAAIAPLAEVHHAFAASARRTGERRPVSLFDIGRSTAVYIRRRNYADPGEIWARILRRETLRLHRHLVRGTCEPRDIRALLGTLADGWAEGFACRLPPLSALAPKAPDAFRPVPARKSAHLVITSRLLRRRRALERAEAAAASGAGSSVFSFSLTPVRHHVRMTDAGVWLQTGGQFGRSDRDSAWFRWCRFADRSKEEICRVAKQRGIGEN